MKGEGGGWEEEEPKTTVRRICSCSMSFESSSTNVVESEGEEVGVEEEPSRARVAVKIHVGRGDIESVTGNQSRDGIRLGWKR